jgi:hypothetical protein
MDGKVVRKLSEGDDRVDDPGFSPDGKFVVFWANAGLLGDPGFDGGDVVVASTDGEGKPRRVTKCRPRTMNTTQSPTTPQPHRRHRSHIPLSLRSIAMKAVSPSPASRWPIPTSSQPLCRAVPHHPQTRMPATDFAVEGPRPCRHRGAQLGDGSREHE